MAEAGGYERHTVAIEVPEFMAQLPARAVAGHGEAEYSEGPDRTFVMQTDCAFAAV
ncbi:MAG TPA: hypothetical protein VEK07_25710 [Polyangiaceae bacterium]|nr:hypothetical protein [Polyangiaceae bacterium]